MNPERQPITPAPEQRSDSELPTTVLESGTRITAVEQPVPTKEKPKPHHELAAAHRDIERVLQTFALEEPMSRDDMNKLQEEFTEHRKKLEGKLQTAFLTDTEEDAERRREIQNLLNDLDNIRERLRVEKTTQKAIAEAHQNHYLSEGDQDQFARLRAWAEYATEDERRGKVDSLRRRLRELEREKPQTAERAAQREHAMNATKDVIAKLEAPRDVPASKTRRRAPERSGVQYAPETLENQIAAARKKVMAKYGKPPEDLDPEEIEDEGVLGRIRNAAAALTGDHSRLEQQEPYQEWETLMNKKKNAA